MKSTIFKPVATMALLGVTALLSTGCSSGGLHGDLLGPPGYTAAENASRQIRYAGFDFQQAIDDFDKNVTMTRPGSMMTTWNVTRND